MTFAALKRPALALMLVAVPSVMILPLLFSGKMLYGGDVVSVFHYGRIVIAEALRSGRLPTWDPHVMAGFPLLAGLQGALFYPPTWLCVILSAGTFWTVTAWLHIVAAGQFARLWLRSGLGTGEGAAVAGAFVYMMSGYILGHLYAGHVNYVWAYPWIPALLWRLERYAAAPTIRSGVWLAVVFAMLFLAGVPQFVFFAGLIVAVRLGYFILADSEGRRDRARRAGKGIGWLALGLLFCGPQLFPTLELASQMHRGNEDDENFMSAYSIQPEDLAQILLPPPAPAPQDNPSGQPFWEKGLFIGGCAILFAGAAFLGKHRQRYLWLGVGVVALILSMGPHVPFYKGFVAVVPGAGLFRGPVRYLLLFTVAASALASFGFDWLWTHPKGWLRFAVIPVAVIGVAQLYGAGNPLILPQDPDLLRWPPEIAILLKRTGPDGRVASSGGVGIEAVGKCQAIGFSHVCGYEPMMLGRYAEVMNSLGGRPPDQKLSLMTSVGPHPVIEMLGANVWVTAPPFQAPPGRDRRWKSLATMGRMTFLEYRSGFPRAWVVNNAAIIESKGERLDRIARGPFDPRRTVILESFPSEAPPITTQGSAGTAKVISHGPGEYRIEAENAADAYLVLSEAYYPGWTAEADGKSAEVLPANHLIQTIRLPPGKHEVRFAYHSRFLPLGFVVAVLAALVPAILAGFSSRRRSTASAGASGAPSTGGS